MNHRGHLAAGALAGTGVAAAAWSAGGADSIPEAGLLFALTTGFALFPDLDVASVSQRWYARGVVAGSIALMIAGAWHAAAVLGAVALLPMVHHHRGWTHHWAAVLLVPLAVLWLWQGLGGMSMAEGVSPGSLLPTRESVLALIAYAPAYLAMALGYAAHLLVDRVPLARG